jgi:hypothetical protein
MAFLDKKIAFYLFLPVLSTGRGGIDIQKSFCKCRAELCELYKERRLAIDISSGIDKQTGLEGRT